MTAIVQDNVDEKRRRLLLVATSAAGAAVGAGVAAPFLVSWFPSARALAAGAPVEADISKLEPGQQITIEWRGKPVWVLRRTPEMLDRLPQNAPLLVDPESKASKQPDYVKGPRPLDQARGLRRRGRLHAPGLLADAQEGGRRRLGHGRRLAGRLLLPVPQLALRPRRARLQGLARADEPDGPAAPLRRATRWW